MIPLTLSDLPTSIPYEKRVAAVADHNRKLGIDTPEEKATAERDANVLEKTLQHKSYQILRANGWTVYNLSQPRATKQSVGISDALLFGPRGEFVLVEFKTLDGVQSQHQKEFQSHCERCGVSYVIVRSEADAWKLAREV